MTAIGEEPDTSIIPAEYLDEKGRLKIDESSYQVGKNLFAGGDFVTGPSTVTAAIAAGRKAAGSINRYLNGPETKIETPDVSCGCANSPKKFNSRFLKKTVRNEPRDLSVAEKLMHPNSEETGGLDGEAMVMEANRCLNCSCVAVNPSDTAPVLIALEAKIITTQRQIAAAEFFAAGLNRSTLLEEDEIVKAIEIPLPSAAAKTSFTKFALRKSIDFPVVNCAAAIEIEAGVVKSARICLNSVYNVPVRVTAAEAMICGQPVSESLAEQAAQAGLAGAFPLVNNQYKIYVAKTLVKRAILECASIC
jgi:CO/xanthine dehydrogenase FAD-binding subunit